VLEGVAIDPTLAGGLDDLKNVRGGMPEQW